MEKEKTKNVENTVSISRRYFLEIVGGGAIGVVSVGSVVLTAQYLSPNVLHEPPLKFSAGLVQDFPPDSVTLIPDQKSYVVRAKEGYFYAMSGICSHLGCITGWKSEEGLIACPCHGSKFDTQGNVVEGPATRPLDRYSISLEDKGRLIVDKGNLVGQDHILKV
ncbi:MAG: Rieske (2Fe-2S) protein [Ignavibacteriae bacterium]|nr:Rieske (2Fe-2S) protein [Ignavibacteriota bacterium]